jgi:organic hydroperoxide reductase OsmC/OhrA
MSEESIKTKLLLIDGYKFDVDFDVDYLPNLVADEPKPIGEGSGPNAPRLLAAAVGQCMSSSLIYCLKKARIPIRNLETTVKTNLFKNEKGQTRIRSIDVQIELEVNKEAKTRVHRCLTIFEDYCTVTQSIRNGIQVNVKVN